MKQPPGTGNAHSFNSSQEFDLIIDGTECLLLLEYCHKYNCRLAVTHGKSDTEFIFRKHKLYMKNCRL